MTFPLGDDEWGSYLDYAQRMGYDQDWVDDYRDEMRADWDGDDDVDEDWLNDVADREAHMGHPDLDTY